KQPVERNLILQLFRPRNWVRLMSLYFNRSQLAAEYYDEHLFKGATFGQLEQGIGPEILINATDLSAGSRFAFTPAFFDPLCSDLWGSRCALGGRAPAAGPFLSTRVTLENRAGSCGYEPPKSPMPASTENDAVARLRALERDRASYLDVERRPYIHLLDGGIAD